MDKQDSSLLAGCRVLDLTSELGLLAGKILGDFGADVIKVEKPGGDAARGVGPFDGNVPHPEKSLFWLATNASKRGITLDIENREGKGLLRRLVRDADIVLESFEPGYLDAAGLGYSDLARIKAGIILTSITPFGQTGPYAHYRATDIVGAAMGGLVRILGDLGRPPVRMSCDPQAYFNAGLQGAVGSTIAYYHQQLTGEGQHVDVSMQDAVILTLMNTVEIAEYLKANMIGTGQFFLAPKKDGVLTTRIIQKCQDGYAYVSVGGGAFLGMARASQNLIRWANEEGLSMELKDVDWTQWDGMSATQKDNDWRDNQVGEFIRTKTKAELMDGAVKRTIMMAPCNNIEDVISSPHLRERGFWETVEHPELGKSLTYPGAPVKMAGEAWKIRRRAPLIGEHNREVYQGELGLNDEQMGLLKANGVI